MYLLGEVGFCLLCCLIFHIEAHKLGKQQSDDRLLCPCGSNTQTKNARVVGGKNAGRGIFPYATGLVYGYSETESRNYGSIAPFCGGTLITDRHVVTAAHCLRERTSEDISLDVGDYDLENPKHYMRRAAELIRHPGYEAHSFQNDIAIIEMDQPINWTSGAKAAWIVAPHQDINPSMRVTVYGWGRLDYNGGRAHVLQSLELPVIENEMCQKKFHTTITENMLCAGGEVGRDACIGDSGSGLMVRLDNDYALCGVVSFGKRCAMPHIAGVYTRVPNFVDWIYKETRDAGCRPCIAESNNI